MTETSDRTGGVETRFPRHPRSVGRARAVLRTHLSAWGVEGDTADSAELLISELMTNAVRHARVPHGREIEARFTLTGRLLRLEVSDASDRLPVPAQAGTEAEGGRGLALVAALARDWGVRHREGVGKCVWALLELTGAPGPVSVRAAAPPPAPSAPPAPAVEARTARRWC
ncbi:MULTISPECIES: ATP-binding protein [Streptomyces]|uniref:ATP-binding protein n=1 Tax=Streptomyces TaxID=1883 RepID=UPI001D13B7A9|nr:MULTISPECIES: ATP-binding protein [Streptomyces]MCC3653913.1 ATP-binding protein [Streptomyces sp. S07_1.15]WSQ71572.1 ATP-binding protein [Streptomyces xinghaiensis]